MTELNHTGQINSTGSGDLNRTKIDSFRSAIPIPKPNPIPNPNPTPIPNPSLTLFLTVILTKPKA